MIVAAGGSVDAAVLSWGDTDVLSLGRWAHPDYVLAADVVYRQELFAPLLQTLNTFPSETITLLAHVRRWKSDTRFWRLAKKDFNVVDLTVSEAHQSSAHTKGALKLFRLEQKPLSTRTGA